MAISLTSLRDLTAAPFDTIIDVRAPSEFAIDHVPGAINLPVLSDDERARVGTLYVQDSPFKARKVGAALVARNAAAHIENDLMGFDGGWQPLVYCWRGGQRSGSFAAILAQIGWRVETISGGYQSYRRLVVDRLYEAAFPAPVILLDGNTGTAKTEVIARLPALGVQAIDLEGLANHRGSALGAVGVQPAQKAFETALAAAVDALDPSRPVVVEAESSKIGALSIPPSLLVAMRDAPRITIEAPLKARAAYLTQAYKDVIDDGPVMVARLEKLVRLQGHERVARWSEMAVAGAYEAVAEELIRDHYDPAYRKARLRSGAGAAQVVTADALESDDIDRLAGEIADVVRARAGGLPQG
ncbi:MAG: tRNA 2-selenouridine(34) synthase MnmH [Paracoccaceae bacterium]